MNSPVAHASLDPGQIVQIEIPVRDLSRALEFYRAVFGWTRSPAEIHNYVVLDVPEVDNRVQRVGVALVPVGDDTARETLQVVTYFRHDDPEMLIKKIIEAGGSKRFGPRKLPAYGDIWQFCDPDGNRFGLFKP